MHNAYRDATEPQFNLTHKQFASSYTIVAVEDYVEPMITKTGIAPGTGKEISFTQAVEIITKAANKTGAFDYKNINEFISEEFPINIDFDVDGKPMMFDGTNWRYVE